MSTVMAPEAGTKLLTAEEYFLLADPPGMCTELVRGKVVEMARPSFRHGKRQFGVAKLIDAFAAPRRLGQVVTETGVITERDLDTVRGPDVAYWSAERIPVDVEPAGYAEVAPDLAIEILSPSNRPGKMLEKVTEYFGAGVRMVWLIDPEDRVCWVYASAERATFLHETATLDGGDVLPGFSCLVAELFE